MNLQVKVVSGLFLILSLSHCGKKVANTGTGDKKYSIYVRAKDGQEFLIQTNSLSEGSIHPIADGLKMNTEENSREMIVKDAKYYYLNYKSNEFFKSVFGDGGLQHLGSVNMNNFSPENYRWTGADTLLIVGLDSTYTNPTYFLLETSDLHIISTGRIDLPSPPQPYNSFSIGFTDYKNSQLLVGYNYHKLEERDYTTGDTLYVAALKYPEMTRQDIAKDIRSTYPGGYNIIQSYFFTDEQGDFYFMTCPGILLGRRPEKSTAILRIKKEESKPDSTYFFDVSGSTIGNHAYGMWYLGNGRVIVRSEKNGSFSGWNDYHNVHQFSFHILDLTTKSVTRLDLPPDKGGRKECVLVEDGIAYIAINSTSEGNIIWHYDIQSGTLEKGLALEDDVDYIFRIDRLN